MAKGKYEYWISPDGLLLLEAWARDGLTDEQIASKIGINRDTLYDWKKRFADISDALKKGKEVVDILVENALYKKTLGYKETIRKPIKCKKVEYADGKRISEIEEVIYATEEVYIPADTTAQIFWLKNRKPAEWREKQEIKVDGNINNPYQGISTDDLKKLISDG
jgi:transposase-like protein